jgi:hypothetical protein
LSISAATKTTESINLKSIDQSKQHTTTPSHPKIQCGRRGGRPLQFPKQQQATRMMLLLLRLRSSLVGVFGGPTPYRSALSFGSLEVLFFFYIYRPLGGVSAYQRLGS